MTPKIVDGKMAMETTATERSHLSKAAEILTQIGLVDITAIELAESVREYANSKQISKPEQEDTDADTFEEARGSDSPGR